MDKPIVVVQVRFNLNNGAVVNVVVVELVSGDNVPVVLIRPLPVVRLVHLLYGVLPPIRVEARSGGRRRRGSVFDMHNRPDELGFHQPKQR